MILYKNIDGVFGDGTHESTQLVMQLVNKQHLQNKKVLDIGTGTGIQSINAYEQGAAYVTATDLSPSAVLLAQKNFEKNNVIGKVIFTDLVHDIDEQFDLIITNLPCHIYKDLFNEHIEKNLVQDGLLIMSWPNCFDMKRELNLNNFQILDSIIGDEYSSYILRRRK